MTIRLPEEYRNRIQEVSEKTGLKKSDVARLALKKFLEDFEQGQEDRPSKSAGDLMGVVSSGLPDLGTNHRRHLLSKIREQKS